MKNVIIVLVYVDNCIIVSDSQTRIHILVHLLKNEKKQFILTEEEMINKFLGISITQLEDERYLTIPYLKNHQLHQNGLPY